MIHPSNSFIYCWLQPSLIDLLCQTQAPLSECYCQWLWFFHQTPRLNNCCPATQSTHSAITRVPLSASSQLWCVKTPCMAVWKTFKSDSPSLAKFISALQLVSISSQRAVLSIRNLLVKHFASCRPFLVLTHILRRYNNWPFWPLGDSAKNFKHSNDTSWSWYGDHQLSFGISFLF